MTEKTRAIEALAAQLGFDPAETELLPELAPYLHTTKSFLALRHPLVYEVPYFGIAGMANERYRQKLAASEQALAEGRWRSYVFLHERPHRIGAFQDIERELDDAAYWELLGDIWSDSENIWQNADDWAELLRADRDQRELLMDEDERAAFAALPDTLTIYRGYTRGRNADGWSWTLDRKRARWFAERLNADKPAVRKATIAKADAIAYLQGRGEEEIIFDPSQLD